MGHAPAGRRSRGIFPPSPFCHGPGLLSGALVPALLAPGRVPGSGQGPMWSGVGSICAGGGGGGCSPIPVAGCSWGVSGLPELGRASPARFPQPAVCVFGVPVCVYLPCMCLRLYLSGASVCVFVFPSAPSPQTWGKLLFLIRGQNRLVAMLVMALLIRPFGTDLSECSLRSGLPWGPAQR